MKDRRAGKRVVAVAAALLWAAPAAAQDCVALFEKSLRTGKQAFFSCFARGATWLDHEGWRRGDEGLKAGIQSLLSAGIQVPKSGLRRSYSPATGTLFLADATGSEIWTGLPPHYIFVVELAKGGWKAMRVYRSGAPWPQPPKDLPLQPPPQEARALLDRNYRAYMAGESVARWKELWDPRGELAGFNGRVYKAVEVQRYLEALERRYTAIELLEQRQHRGPELGGIVSEGIMHTRCRAGGSEARTPMFNLLRFKDGRCLFSYVAMTGLDEACGPWESE